MKELFLIVTGKVQGVFFRATAKEIAEELQLSGYAKNLNDGSVEILVQGMEQNLSTFLDRIKKNKGSSKISDVKETLRDPIEKMSGFQIL